MRSWMLESVSAGAAAALVAGSVEVALRVGGGKLGAAAVSYAVLGLWPAMAVGSMIARLAILGWTPRREAEPDSSLPSTSAYVLSLFLVSSLALLALGSVAWLTVAWASRNTAFHARTLAALLPLPIAAGAALLVALGWPCARGLAHLLHRLDARRLARGAPRRLTGLRVAAILLALAAGALAALVTSLRFQLKLPIWPLVAPLLLTAMAPTLAACVCAGWHALARSGRPALARLRRPLRRIVLGLAGCAVIGALAIRAAAPALLLDVWGAPGLASFVVERVHPLEALRGAIPPAAVALAPLPGATSQPDVVLITIDTVRADRMPPQNPNPAMPALTQLAARGAVFTRAFASSSATRRSVPSLVTSLSPTRVRGKMSGWALQLDPRHVLLAERFAAAGYETAGFFCCEHFWSRTEKRDMGWSRGLETLVLEKDGAKLAAKARSWLTQRRERGSGEHRPLFLWVHFIEPHEWNGGALLLPAPHEVLPRYDASLIKVDAMVATLLDGFSGGPEPLVAVTSDHGEGLGEHGTVFHSSNLYNSLLRIPLVVAGPGVLPAQHAEVVSLVDVAPTLVELAGFAPPPPPIYEGRSLAQLAQGRRKSDDDGGYAYAVMMPDYDIDERREAIVRGRWKLISSRRGLELYDYVADPKEETNLAGAVPEPSARAELWQLLKLRRGVDERSPFTPLSR